MIHSWRKASYSGSKEGGGCVELARLDADTAGVRDSTNPDGPRHEVNVGALRRLLREIKDGQHALT